MCTFFLATCPLLSPFGTLLPPRPELNIQKNCRLYYSRILSKSPIFYQLIIPIIICIILTLSSIIVMIIIVIIKPIIIIVEDLIINKKQYQMMIRNSFVHNDAK